MIGDILAFVRSGVSTLWAWLASLVDIEPIQDLDWNE